MKNHERKEMLYASITTTCYASGDLVIALNLESLWRVTSSQAKAVLQRSDAVAPYVK